jgi:hypothetical protein
MMASLRNNLFPAGFLRSVTSRLEITLVDVTYRMNMYFEDAGKMKFARNMRMPGSIEDEIKDLIRAALF